MVSPPTSSPETSTPLLGFRGLDGTPLVAPDEWAPAYVEVRVPVGDRHRVRVARNGSALPILLRVLDGSELIVAEWPRSGPGHYSLSLECPPIRAEQRLTITPKKITREAFAVLLDDLERRLPAAVALALQRAGALSGIKLLPPEELTHAQELQRLRRVVQGTSGRMGLAAVLAALAHDPHRVLRTVTVPVRAGDARRPDPLRLTLAIAQGRDLGASGLPEHVADRRVEHTVDVYENRVVRLLHDAVDRRLRRLARAVGRGRTGWSDRGPRPDPTQDEVLALLQSLVRSRRQAGFLDDVSLPTSAPSETTMVLMRRQPYRAVLEALRELHLAAWVRLEEPALEAPLENLPVLYQLWCTLEVIDAVVTAAVAAGYQLKLQRLVSHDAAGVFVRVLPDGQPSVVLVHASRGAVLRLIPERTYAPGSAGLRSLSYAQRPDIAIEVESPGERPRLYLLDPKYKLDSELLAEAAGSSDGKPKKIDIDKMHTYRDAIRGDDLAAVVEHAAILYPGPRVAYPEGTGEAGPVIEAISAMPGATPSVAAQVRPLLARALGLAEPGC